ncbi:uncharacterized protein ACMZJ9_007526 [Mantella aurantiaca]
MNILFRYGEIHNLTFALPVRFTYYYYPNFFLASYVDNYSEREKKTFNIMCHHMRFIFPEVEKVMPTNTFYFTVMRNPISLMESSFSYYKNNSPFTIVDNLEDFLQNTSAYYDAKIKERHVAKNFMTFDLGFDPNGLDTIKNVKIIKAVVDTIFDLVLITEYFDESLILLKDALCWSFDDILSFPLNKRSNTTKKVLTLETQEKVKKWNSLDWELYVYFNNSFWKRVETYGRRRMEREVKILQRKRGENKKECLQDEVAPSLLKNKFMMPHQSGIASILGYNLKPEITTNRLLCQRLITPEIQYTNLLRYKQIRKNSGSAMKSDILQGWAMVKRFDSFTVPSADPSPPQWVVARTFSILARIPPFRPVFPPGFHPPALFHEKLLPSASEVFRKRVLHIWWECLVVHRFWNRVFDMPSTLFGTSLDPHPGLTLLTLQPDDFRFKTPSTYVLPRLSNYPLPVTGPTRASTGTAYGLLALLLQTLLWSRTPFSLFQGQETGAMREVSNTQCMLTSRSLRHLRLLFTICIITGFIYMLTMLQNLNTSVCDIAQKPTMGSSNIDVITKKSCKPHTHIFFMKTHKTASSTIMNILFRFGESNNLSFALPSYNASQFFYPFYFNAAFVENFVQNFRRTTHKFDIMCHHMRFHLQEVEKVMPKDTFYFTILRNPVSLMESSFAYYKTTDIFINAKTLEEYLMNPYKFYNITSQYSSFGRNLMTFDLGLNNNGPESSKYFQLAQKTIEIMFDLVLITEYFDESLVLLKDALCWTFDDILSFPLNSRSNATRKVLPVRFQQRIKIWNQLDWQLYVYFNNTFWKKVDEFGHERMKQEVEELRMRRSLQSEICLQGQVDPTYIKDEDLKPFQAGIARILGYNLKQELVEAERSMCKRLITPELQYTQLLLNKQYPKANKTKIVKNVRKNKFHRSGRNRAPL